MYTVLKDMSELQIMLGSELCSVL